MQMQQGDAGLSDSALVSAARAGDRDAFGALFSRHRPMLVALCRRWLGGAEPAEDIIQEAALQAMLNLDRLQKPERFGAWLAGIGLNLCRRWYRESRQAAWSLDDVYGGRFLKEPVDFQPVPETIVEEGELREAVRRAVAELPPRQRAAVVLFYLSGLTYAETAAALGTGPGAIRTRLHNARRQLRRSLVTLWQEEHMTSDVASSFVEMRIAGVWQKRMDEVEGRAWTSSVVVLEDVEDERQLPIWIGYAEGLAMAGLLEKVEPPRPLTYTFIASLLQAAGARLQEVRITRLAGDMYFATAVIQGPAGAQSVDARPSDALNLALAAGAPVFAARSVLDTAEAGFQERFGHPSTTKLRFSELGWSDSVAIAAESMRWVASAEERRKRRASGEPLA
jgi:RNA polymerase sigma factor (sigma-70 family)